MTTDGQTEVRFTDPETGGQKGQKLEAHALVPVAFREEVARVYGKGAEKYSPNNWRKGYPWDLSLSALQRHIDAFAQGESYDPDDGLHHLAHAAFHLGTLFTFDVESGVYPPYLALDNRHIEAGYNGD